MKTPFKLLVVLALFASTLFAGAEETFNTLEVNGLTYTNVTVTVVTATDIYFTHNSGMGAMF